jgi:thiamine biosynthesis lipoprotein
MIYMNGALLGTTAFASVLAIAVPAQNGIFHFHDDHVLGTSLDITTVGNDEPAAVLAVSAIRAEISRLDKVLSGWREDSELQALNSSCATKASPDLFRVIAACEDWRGKTNGAYSARLGTLLNNASDAAQTPSPGRARAMASEISSANIQFDPSSRRIVRPQSVKFAVDGLAKGYIIDRALEAARHVAPCLKGLMIDIGGDMRCWGLSSNERGWTVGVVDHANGADNAPPSSVLRVNDKAVATSGRGNRVQTLLSPISGQPSVHVALATVVADKAADADALATAFAVMAPEDSMTLADQLPGVAARVVTADGQCHTSSGWGCLVQEGWKTPRPIQIADTVAPNGPLAWPKGFAVDIGYEVPAGMVGRRERPYVTIWITNEKNDLVRTLAFFAGKRRYFDSNYVFWRRNGAANQAIINSVTRPTRGPGRYTLTWDGLDDHGVPVPQGKYLLFVEASREHGDHSIQRIELDVGSAEFTAEATGSGELGQTKVVYGRGA